jgi:hypothetical protein
VEFPEGLGGGEACGRDADEGGPYGLAGQFGDAARVVAFLEVGEGCGLGESKFPGWSPRPVSMASVQPDLEVRRRVGRLSTPRRATWHSPGAARKSLPARRSMIRVLSPACSRAAAVRRVLGTPSDPLGVRTPVL